MALTRSLRHPRGIVSGMINMTNHVNLRMLTRLASWSTSPTRLLMLCLESQVKMVFMHSRERKMLVKNPGSLNLDCGVNGRKNDFKHGFKYSRAL